MRLFTALVLLLIVASPALAQKNDNLDSDSQVTGYGHIFGYVCAAASVITVLLVGAHIIKGMIAESARGKKSSQFREEILDKAPRKEHELVLGEKVPAWKTDNRLKATRAALKFLAATDKWFGKKKMAAVVEEVFRGVKHAIEVRTAKSVVPFCTAEYLAGLRAEIKKLKEKGDLHVFGTLEVTAIEIVHFEAPTVKLKHTFTALISAQSKDYFKDEKTGEVLRGDKKVYSYQEFWRFRRTKERWLLERVRSAEDMDRVLEPKNVMAQADLARFTKEADEEHLREFVGR